MRYSFCLGIVALMTATGMPTAAQSSVPLELTGYVELETVTTDEAGNPKAERVEPAVVVPGDKLIFGTRFANNGTVPIERFVVSNPVPATVRVMGEIDPSVLVSVDGGTGWGKLAELEIADAGGARRPAQLDDITHVRWVLPRIAPGETGTVEFPVTVR